MAITMVLTGPKEGQTIALNKGAFVFREGKLVLKGGFEENEGTIKYLGRCYAAFPANTPQLKAAQEAYRGPSQNQPTQAGRPDAAVGDAVQPSGGESTQVPSQDGDGDDDAEVVPEGGGPQGDGHPDPGNDELAKRRERILEALNTIDHGDDELWTGHGTARIDAVEKASGLTGVSRAEVEAAAPDFLRSQPHT